MLLFLILAIVFTVQGEINEVKCYMSGTVLANNTLSGSLIECTPKEVECALREGMMLGTEENQHTDLICKQDRLFETESALCWVDSFYRQSICLSDERCVSFDAKCPVVVISINFLGKILLVCGGAIIVIITVLLSMSIYLYCTKRKTFSVGRLQFSLEKSMATNSVAMKDMPFPTSISVAKESLP